MISDGKWNYKEMTTLAGLCEEYGVSGHNMKICSVQYS